MYSTRPARAAAAAGLKQIAASLSQAAELDDAADDSEDAVALVEQMVQEETTATERVVDDDGGGFMSDDDDAGAVEDAGADEDAGRAHSTVFTDDELDKIDKSFENLRTATTTDIANLTKELNEARQAEATRAGDVTFTLLDAKQVSRRFKRARHNFLQKGAAVELLRVDVHDVAAELRARIFDFFSAYLAGPMRMRNPITRAGIEMLHDVADTSVFEDWLSGIVDQLYVSAAATTTERAEGRFSSVLDARAALAVDVEVLRIAASEQLFTHMLAEVYAEKNKLANFDFVDAPLHAEFSLSHFEVDVSEAFYGVDAAQLDVVARSIVRNATWRASTVAFLVSASVFLHTIAPVRALFEVVAGFATEAVGVAVRNKRRGLLSSDEWLTGAKARIGAGATNWAAAQRSAFFALGDLVNLYAIAGASISLGLRAFKLDRNDAALRQLLILITDHRECVRHSVYAQKVCLLERFGGMIYCDVHFFESVLIVVGKVLFQLGDIKSIEQFQALCKILKSSDWRALVQERLDVFVKPGTVTARSNVMLLAVVSKFSRIVASLFFKRLQRVEVALLNRDTSAGATTAPIRLVAKGVNKNK